MKKTMALVTWAMVGAAAVCHAGWLNPSQPGFVIQTYTTYQPISGNNSGTIATNGNSFQFAGDNFGLVYIGGPGSQFRGRNEGNVYVDNDGGFVLGAFGPLAVVTNRGKGSLILGNLSGGQKATITDVAHGSLLLGAGTVSNSQSIVVGDDNGSHGSKSVTAGSMWATGAGFFDNGGGLTNLAEHDTNALAVLSAHAALSVGVHGAAVARYVATNGSHVSPFTSWATAATNIQAAVDVAQAGETVWVGSGTYASGSRACGGWNNRVAVTNAITVRSVSGPAATRIVGTDGADMTGVYLAPNTWLIGMTVTNFRSWSVDVGGVYGGCLSNCVLAGNLGYAAGGAYTSTLYQCTLSGNEGAAGGGAALGATLYNCVLEQNASDYAAWRCVSSSADGTVQWAIVAAKGIYKSTDYGTTWVESGPSQWWGYLTSSPGGAYHLATMQNGGLWLGR